jgi:uncharacterized ion transporter superfamily protein YfcC
MSLLKKLQVPHVFVLLAGVVLVCSLLTFVVPSGVYDSETKIIEGHERTLLKPGTYTHLEKQFDVGNLLLGKEIETETEKATPVGLHGFLTAIPRGMERAGDIIFFIFVVGGVFSILTRTGVITAGLARLLDRFGSSGPALTMVLMTVLAVGGSTLGMGEEFIPLVPIFLLVSKKLGYDRIYGMALVMLAADVGFAASTTNPFTVCVAQGIAELPLYSGLPLRLVFFVCALTLAIGYTLRYGAKIKADPSASFMPDDKFEIEVSETQEKFNNRHLAILISSTAIFAFILFATQRFGWWMADMAGGFLLMGIVAAIIGKLSVEDSVDAFVVGMRDMVVAALVVGFARGISVVLEDGQIMHTIVFGAASVLTHVPRYVAAIGMLFFESSLNLLIPSGSGQAAVTVPLMAPLSDIIGISRQTAVLAFTSGDGFSNTIIPTSGVLMAMLSLAKIPYGKWVKFMFPLFLMLMGLSSLFLVIAVAIDYS